MKSNKIIRAAAITITSAGMILPQSQLLAAAPQLVQSANSQADGSVATVSDVSLAEGGVLRGQVVDSQGQPVADAPVSVLYEGKAVASTKTVADGSFAVRGLRGGTHVVVSGEHGGICRTWVPNSAPPSARQGFMIVRSSQLARGQGFKSGAGLLMAGALGGVVAGGLIAEGSTDDNGHGSGS